MTWYHILYFISILIIIGGMGLVSWYSRHRRIVPGASALMWISLSICILALFEGLSIISPTRQMASFWFNMKFLPLAVIPVLWLLFAIQYSGKHTLITKCRLAALFIVPLITLVMLWTNDIHGLWVKNDVEFFQTELFFISLTGFRIPGIWYKLHLIYSHFIMATRPDFIYTDYYPFNPSASYSGHCHWSGRCCDDHWFQLYIV